jgi:polysaccharide deacetylase 2 family uncharacterized protein YibQ
MNRAARPGQRLWQALAAFWIVVLLVAGGTVGLLAWLGPPPVLAPRALLPPAEEPPRPAPVTAAPVPPAPLAHPAPEAATVTQAPAPTAPMVAAPPASLALPEAPEPPPLSGSDIATAAEHPIQPPDAALLEPSPAGPLPRVGPDGRQPRHAYARPFDRADTRPRLALVMLRTSDAALKHLPGPVGLVLEDAQAPLLAAARARGMETLLLLRAGTEDDAPEPALARFAGYVGVLGAGDISPATQQRLRDRGLLLLDPHPGASAPAIAWGRAADLVLEDAPTRGEIDRQLETLERLAREGGSALGILPGPRLLMVERVASWAAGLPGRGLVLAPVTAMIRRPTSAER